MKLSSLFSLVAVPALLLTLSACQKSEPAGTAKVEKVEAAPAPEVKKEVPAIPTGVWAGTKADNSNAATMTIEAGNRMTIIQQDSTTAGTYSIDTSASPAVLTFTPDGPSAGTYNSQIQWLDPNTVTMTSFIEASAPAAPAATAPSAQPNNPEPEPFTGSVPPPPNHIDPATVSAPAEPVMSSEIITITFRKQ